MLLLLSLGFATAVSFLSQLDLGVLGTAVDGVVLFAGGHASSYVFLLVTVGLLYKVVPYESPSWREMLPGASFAALLTEIAKTLFVHYINGVSQLATERSVVALVDFVGRG